MKNIVFLLTFFISIHADSQIDSLSKYYKLGIANYEAGDYSGFLEKMMKADGFRPFYPPVIYNISAGYALAGKEDQALEYLKSYLAFNSLVDFESDSDFDSIRDSEKFKSTIALAQNLSKKIHASQPYKTISGARHIESIAINTETDELYLGDVNARKVFVFNRKEALNTIIDFQEYPDLYGVMGLDFHKNSNTLWVCSSALPQIVNYDESLAGSSSLFSIDLNTKIVKHHGTLKDGNTFGDLIVSKSGQVLISDGGTNTIFTLNQNGDLEVFADLASETFNLQGLTISEDEKSLYISDYISGIYKLDMDSRKLSRIAFESGIPFKGIDGLYFYNESLLGIQNGTKPMRILQLFLNEDGNRVMKYASYDQNMDYLNEPTQGYLLDRDFIYISNSPWAQYTDDLKLEGDFPIMLRKILIK